MPGKIKEGGWDSVGVVELPALPLWEDVPTPELNDSFSTRESEKTPKGLILWRGKIENLDTIILEKSFFAREKYESLTA